MTGRWSTKVPQISLLSGIASDSVADWRSSLPVNLIPVPKDTGVSKGYLRFAPGLTQFGSGPGIDRGAIAMDGTCYRVMGASLVTVDGSGGVFSVGSVTGGSAPVSMDYSTDNLCVVSSGNAYLYNGTTVTKITDPDIGAPIDVVWVDGYFLFTDGRFIYVTELTDPASVDPLKYASSEIDPDRIVGVLKYRNEVYVLNRHTIEVFDNIGGTGFPFTRLAGGLIPKGCVGTKAKTLFAETFAWVGGARNEPPSVYLAAGGSAAKIATREVEIRLAAYSEEQLSACVVEARADRMHQLLYIHLPDETLVYDAMASAVAGEPIWFFMSTGVSGIQPYRARNFVWCHGKWIVGDTQDGRIGHVDESVATQYGEIAGWRFDTMLLYNEGRGAIVHSLELSGTTGRAPSGERPTVFTSYTADGRTWSDEKQASMGTSGQTRQRVVFRRLGKMGDIRGIRFRGANATPISWSRLQAELEPLYA